MEELLQHLEIKIKNLIDQHQHVKQSNHSLHEARQKLAHEKEELLQKQSKAVTQIEVLVSKLKTIEILS